KRYQLRNMTEVAPAAVRSSAKLSMKKSASRTRKDGPSISKLIVDAVADSKERKGVSLAALKKLLARNGVDVTKSNKRINSAITKLVTGGSLSRTRGTGASGSFKIAKPKARKKKPKPAKPVKKATPKKKKKAPAKAKRPAAKKSPKKSPAKKPARKSPKKGPAKKTEATARRPKPAKRPAAKRSPAKKRPAKKAKRSYWKKV
uniref:H15 domain-containing protein n=1 Tax=Poecilia formosa TaxID=48698 RepID=A0A087YBU8_POEFO